jgi:hypothetical protein
LSLPPYRIRHLRQEPRIARSCTLFGYLLP